MIIADKHSPEVVGRLAIRSTILGPEVDLSLVRWILNTHGQGFQGIRKKRGSFKGAIRISSCSLSFLFNDEVFLRVPRKSLKSLVPFFSIPTTPINNFLILLWFKEIQGALGRVDNSSSRPWGPAVRINKSRTLLSLAEMQ